MQRVLLTGSSGYIGRALCDALAQEGYRVRAACRAGSAVPASAAERVLIDDIGPNTSWNEALDNVDIVYHLAALAHILQGSQALKDAYFQTNALGTLALARAAAGAGVKRFVYLSTIKVNGEATSSKAYTGVDEPNPCGDYAISKWQGEQYLAQAARQSEMQHVIVRPPLVYGPGVRANFLRLMNWIERGLPLPLGAIENRRSLVSIWNLCDLLVRLSKHPCSPNHVWMVSDGTDLSTPGLMRLIARAMGRPARLLPVPGGLLQACGRLIGREAEVARLCDSLSVDVTQTCVELEWNPPMTVDEAIARTVDWYLSEGRRRAT